MIAVLIVSLAVTGCASGSGAGYVKPDVTDAQRDADAKECSHPGMLIAGALTMPLLIFPGVALMTAAGTKERHCMEKRGYTIEASR
ncbi:MAG: hypothetical protein C5B48_04030 [Candidatus Rokuibacteriota bacterium]|nr:MAG: hypothetical protein C5B48_04030 [Candidatus Rokubacteria bacterium]